MEWADEGVVLAVRRHGENDSIAEVLTQARGRCLGLVRGGRSRRARPMLQPGNILGVRWRARLEEHLGTFQIEPVSLSTGGHINNPFRLAGVSTLTTLARLLPEREPHPRLAAATRLVLDSLDNDLLWPALLVRWELGLLDELGFGLDLAKCAVTGALEGLSFVSPRSGRAVTHGAGAAYAARLFPLPAFLLGGGAADPQDILAGFRLSGYFMQRHLFEPRGLESPQTRQWIMDHLAKSSVQLEIAS